MYCVRTVGAASALRARFLRSYVPLRRDRVKTCALTIHISQRTLSHSDKSGILLLNRTKWARIILVLFMNYTYIVECSDGSFYTGWTNDLEKRIKVHNEGKGAKYTKCRRPVVLVYYEKFQTKEEAMSREWAIKHMTREQKIRMIGSDPQ